MGVDCSRSDGTPFVRTDKGGRVVSSGVGGGTVVEFDPLVIMNPLDGKSNVAKSCFAYGSLTWWYTMLLLQ